MPELRLISPGKREIKPIVEAALHNELRLLEAGIRQTENNLRKFEIKYNMSTDRFVSDYENDVIGETVEFAEWIGELRMLERLTDKSEALKSIQFEN
ncbi:MAG: hypothetical protein GY749_17655 [Desulfobacteraceae bacterium]|nr:hypothetical protein [Desulfobacteraceae bacterium]